MLIPEYNLSGAGDKMNHLYRHPAAVYAKPDSITDQGERAPILDISQGDITSASSGVVVRAKGGCSGPSSGLSAANAKQALGSVPQENVAPKSGEAPPETPSIGTGGNK